ncbi:MAG: aconitase X swivel domain-containing protein [Candidatus Hodarchaeales archaeon]
MNRILFGKGLLSMPSIACEGQALVTDQPITFLGFVDKETGEIVEDGHPLNGEKLDNKIFIFPKGIGSTVAPYVLVNLKRNNCAPRAIINRESDSGTIAGASTSRIPLIYRLNMDPTEIIKSGDWIKINVDSGKATVEIIPIKD